MTDEIKINAEPECRLPRLIATDLDGTLVGPSMAISARARLALSRAAAAGATIVLATGRSPRRLADVYAQLGAWYLSICANGAIVYEPTSDLVLAYWPLESVRATEVCERLRKRFPKIVFAAHVEVGRRLLYEPGWPVSRDSQDATCISGVYELTGTDVVKLQARAPDHDPETFARLVADCVGDIAEVTRPGDQGLVEMTKRGVTKAAALRRLAAELRIPPSDALAFGDMPNDISMLQWASRSVAVANAHPTVRAAAREITLSSAEDGVAAYLEQLLAP